MEAKTHVPQSRWRWIPMLLAIGGVAMAAPPQVAKPAANTCRKVDSLAKLPPTVQKLLGVGERNMLGMGIADRGQPFNSTDMFRDDMPSRRLRRACMSDAQVIVLLDLGGIAMHGELKTFVKQGDAWSKDHSVVLWGEKLSVSDRVLLQTVNDAWERRHYPNPPPSS